LPNSPDGFDRKFFGRGGASTMDWLCGRASHFYGRQGRDEAPGFFENLIILHHSLPVFAPPLARQCEDRRADRNLLIRPANRGQVAKPATGRPGSSGVAMVGRSASRSSRECYPPEQGLRTEFEQCDQKPARRLCHKVWREMIIRICRNGPCKTFFLSHPSRDQNSSP